MAGVHNLAADDSRIRFDVDTNELEAVLSRLVGLGILTLTSQPPTLEELFLRHYGDRT
jgi:ABC-2 type transport system ATP-binding protein